jgi:hypothetical protein
MGIPYSREINAAFDQVTPLVAAGFKVLKTTKNISILLAVIQVLTVLCLMAILAVLVAIVYCVDPGLEVSRQEKLLSSLVVYSAPPVLVSVTNAAAYPIQCRHCMSD